MLGSRSARRASGNSHISKSLDDASAEIGTKDHCSHLRVCLGSKSSWLFAAKVPAQHHSTAARQMARQIAEPCCQKSLSKNILRQNSTAARLNRVRRRHIYASMKYRQVC
jgi:hypothetical protein